MTFKPLHAVITRDSEDAEHEPLHDVHAVLTTEPEVGSSLQLFLESGKLMRTTEVQHVERHGSELIVETANSRYHLTLAQAA
jgi:hypothetical protein